MEYYPSSYQGISNSKTVTQKGQYALDAYQNNPNEKGSLRYELDRKMTSGKVYNKSVNLKNMADGETVEVSFDLPEDGFYLVTVWVSACGASSLTKENPYFTCNVKNNNREKPAGMRTNMNINIAKAWDNDNVITFTNQFEQGNVTAQFTSHADGNLSSEYVSAFGIRLVRL